MIIVPNPVGPILIVENADSTKLAVKSPGGVYTELSSTVLRVLSCGHEWGGAESERDASGTSLREVGEGPCANCWTAAYRAIPASSRIGFWNVSSVTNMSSMFRGPTRRSIRNG